MDNAEYDNFLNMLQSVAELYDKNISPTSVMIYFRALERFNYKTVSAAFNHHVQTGKFMPKPADIIEAIEESKKQDGRPTADEAFSIAIQLQDEAATVVSNEEISQAWFEASHVMPDRAGARMAFRSAYERIVKEARAQNRPVSWFPSLGTDKTAREGAVLRAVEQGRLPHTATKLIAASSPSNQNLIGSNAEQSTVNVSEILTNIKKKIQSRE